MILRPSIRIVISLLCLMSSQAYAEGMVELQPYVRAGVLYDDNLFRFASKAEAEAAGFSSQSDRVNTLDAGAQLNLRISRQLVRVNAGINDFHCEPARARCRDRGGSVASAGNPLRRARRQCAAGCPCLEH